MKRNKILWFIAAVSLFFSCSKEVINEDVNKEQELEDKQTITVVMKTSPKTNNTKSMGLETNDNDKFAFDERYVLAVGLDENGNLFLGDDGNPIEATFAYISFTEETSAVGYYTYKSDIVFPSYVKKVAILLNMEGEPDVNYSQGDKNAMVIPASGQADLSNATEGDGTPTNPYKITISIEPLMARIQVINDLENSSIAVPNSLGNEYPYPISLDNLPLITENGGTKMYAPLYAGLRLEGFYLNRTYMGLSIEDLIAGTNSSTIDVTPATDWQFDFHGSFADTDENGDPIESPLNIYEVGAFAVNGDKRGLFNTRDMDLPWGDNGYYQYLNVNAADPERKQDAWVITSSARNVQQDKTTAPTPTIEEGSMIQINPMLRNSFFVEDASVPQSELKAGALGFNIFAQGEDTTDKDVAISKQPHLVIRFSFDGILKRDINGDPVLSTSGEMAGYPIYTLVDGSSVDKYNRSLRNLNLVAFAAVNDKGEKYYPEFKKGYVYTLRLSSIVSAILDPKTPVTEEGHEDTNATYNEIDIQVSHWTEVDVKPVVR